MKDASRSVGICQSLVTAEQRAEFVARIKDEHATRREQHRGKHVKAPQLSLGQARANRHRIDWQRLSAAGAASSPASRVFEDYPLAELSRYIDWMPFFNAWEFAGKFPDVLTDPVVGEAASNLYADARRMLQAR